MANAPLLTDAERAELVEIVRARSFRYGRFTLASGRESDLYFNMKPTMMHARGAALSARALIAIARPLGVAYVGGLEMGAVPVIGSLAALSVVEGAPIDTIFVRKAAKEHGTRQLVEGLGPDESLDGKAVLVIDDVATTGGSTLKAIEAIRAAGGIVTDAACLLDRGEGGAELLSEHGVTLHAVLRAAEFVPA
jgi:orotate phosphoribosyltransferase